jgi:hypothetical protein
MDCWLLMLPLNDMTNLVQLSSPSSDPHGSAMIGSRSEYCHSCSLVPQAYLHQVYKVKIQTPGGQQLGRFEYRVVNLAYLRMQMSPDFDMHFHFDASERGGDVCLGSLSEVFHTKTRRRNLNRWGRLCSNQTVLLIPGSTKEQAMLLVLNWQISPLHSFAERITTERITMATGISVSIKSSGNVGSGLRLSGSYSSTAL